MSVIIWSEGSYDVEHLAKIDIASGDRERKTYGESKLRQIAESRART